jgi:hypothetical protein
MPIFVLLLATVVALSFFGVVEALPRLLWGWIYLPNWLLWPVVLVLFAWCIDDDNA